MICLIPQFRSFNKEKGCCFGFVRVLLLFFFLSDAGTVTQVLYALDLSVFFFFLTSYIEQCDDDYCRAEQNVLTHTIHYI